MEKIIKKKLLLIVSMLAVTFALAGCSSSDKKVEFDYDGNTLVQIAETQATNYMQIAQVEDVYNFYVDEEANGGQVDETTADALKVFSTIESDYGKFQQFKPVNLEDEDDKTIQEVDDKVVVTLYAECAEKEAIVKATFVDNSVTYNFQKYSVMAQNQYSEEEADQMLASNGVYPYKISEFEVAANQTLKDKMKDAGANTLIGMGIVFIALIFISFIISLLKYVPALLDKETREKRKAEKAKKAFAGNEIKGKKLGVIGLGAIGVLVANAASELGMEVFGCDPYLSIQNAVRLSHHITIVKDNDEIYNQCDYITIHVPLLDSTKQMINKEALDKMKDGVVLLNFARDLLVDEDALIEALDSGKVKKYVTDFANHTVAGHKGILVTPHLGASTEESEENCAVMAVKEVRDFLENGNIKNSVNFPNCDMGTCVAVGRIAICHKNIPNMISQFTKILGAEGLNIADMTNKSKGEYAYTLIDLESAASKEALDELKAIEGVSRVRVVK